MQNNLIFLIGFMGAGKTTIGKKLARQLNIDFVDLDQTLENKFGITINEFFTQYGEAAFRIEETKMLKEIVLLHNKAVISVGGGLPCFNENMEVMNREGVTCYLHRPAKELFQRLKTGKTTRPLLRDLEGPELLSFIESKLEDRSRYYEMAKHKFLRHQQTTEYIVEKLAESLSNCS